MKRRSVDMHFPCHTVVTAVPDHHWVRNRQPGVVNGEAGELHRGLENAQVFGVDFLWPPIYDMALSVLMCLRVRWGISTFHGGAGSYVSQTILNASCHTFLFFQLALMSFKAKMFCKACDVFGHPFRTALTSSPKLMRLQHVVTLIAYLWRFI